MVAFVINQFAIRDAAIYKEYQRIGSPTIKEHGGRVLAAGTDVIDLEGNPTFPDGPAVRVIVLEFDTIEAAKAWYNRKQYQRAVRIRDTCADGRMFIVDGLDTAD